MKAHERIVFALDVPNLTDAERYVSTLRNHVGFFKVGLELFIGLQATWIPDDLALRYLQKMMKPAQLILDLKLHDIPETVERALRATTWFKPAFVTIHVQQEETLRRAAKFSQETGIGVLAVTVLTSMGDNDCDDMRYTTRALGRVPYLAEFAYQSGIRGFVCSPKEVGPVRRRLGPNATLMVPGIRRPLRGDEFEIPDPEKAREELMKMRPHKVPFDPPGGPVHKMSPIYCEHANENPVSCPCPRDCYCYQSGNTCANRFQETGAQTGRLDSKSNLNNPRIDDQSRIGTAFDAIMDGADLLVIGRPIRDAQNPTAAASDFASDIDFALQNRRTS